MNIEAIEADYFAYQEGTLSEGERAEVEARLATDTEYREVFEELRSLEEQMEQDPVEVPDAQIRENFLQMLEAEKAAEKPAVRTIQLPVWLVAASASLLVGLFAGWILHAQLPNQSQETVASLEQQLITLQQVVLLSQMEQKSASQRLATVQASQQLSSADPKVVQALVTTLRTDPSDNVRMAAAEALVGFGQQTNVGPALAASLGDQRDPMLQLLLIDMLVSMQEKSAVEELNRLANDQGALEQVRNRAQAGLGSLL